MAASATQLAALAAGNPALRSRRMPHMLAALAVGLATPFQLEWGGVIYASEILLALVAGWALSTNLGSRAFWRRPFLTLIALLGVTMLAYVVTDLALATEFQNMARGWARLIFLSTNFIGLYFLCRRNPFNILIYAVASAAGMLVFMISTGRLLDDWKFGASTPVTLLVACLVPVLRRRGVLVGSMALAAVGIAHIALDSREIGGNCLLAGVLLLARCSSVLRLRSISWAILGVLALAGIGVLLYAYVLTDEEYGQRRQFSNAWRTAALVTAMDGIAQSPWIGNGSQANSFEFQSRYDAIFAERTGVRYRGQQTDTSTFSPHSQILQTWFEAGVFGATFFVYLGWRLAAGFRFCIFSRRLDAFSVLFAYFLLRATWHLLFSPFAGLARLDVAVAAVIVCLLEAECRAEARIAR